MHRIFLFILFILISTSIALSQNIDFYNMLGKKLSDVKQSYGKPVYEDASNPLMHCIFYKNMTQRLVFVSDKSGVFQAEAVFFQSDQNKGKKFVDDYLTECKNNSFAVDTVSTEQYNLSRPGVKLNLCVLNNSYTKMTEITVKAHKSAE